MKNYELVYVVRPNAEDEVKEAVLNKIQEVISANGEDSHFSALQKWSR